MGNPKVTSGVITLKDQGGGVWGSVPNSAVSGGYAAFDVPIIYHSTTVTAIPVKLVRRDGTLGSLTVNIQASAKFNEQGVSAGLDQNVTFLEGEIVKNVTLPLNNIVLDGEAHVQLTINSGPVQARFNEVNTIVIVDTGTVKSGSPIMADPNVDIIQNAVAEDTIIYIQNGDWCDPTTAGFVPGGQDGVNGFYTNVQNVKNCIIRNYPGHSPRIVSPLDFTDIEIPTSPSKYGFYVTMCEYVHIYGLEIIDRMGIYTREWTGNPDQKYPNEYLHFHSNHIHDIYGDINHQNVGGIRLDDAIQSVVFNNEIHDTYDCRTYPYDNGITAEPYDFFSGVHGYRPVDCYIYQNTFYNVYRGVYQKDPNKFELNSHAVLRNRFYNTTYTAVCMEHAGSGVDSFPVDNGLVAENLVIGGQLMQGWLYNGIEPSRDITVRNNTVIGGLMTDIDSTDSIVIYNNLVDNAPSTITWSANGNRSYSASYSMIDFNGYPDESVRFLVDRNASLQSYDTVPLFRTAISTATTILPVDGQENNSVTGEPMFTNTGTGDYSLQVGSPYIGTGRFGYDIGAYYSGSPQIGATL